MIYNVDPELMARARRIVESIDGAPAPVDVPSFWESNDAALADPWSRSNRALPLGIAMSNECVFAELGEPEDWWRHHHDDDYRLALERRYNDAAERAVGRRLLPERPAEGEGPDVKGLHDLFEARQEWHTWSYWLTSSADGPDALQALLDRVERRLEDARAFLLPPGWDRRKAEMGGRGIPLYRGQRGPITFAMSIYGVENLIFLILDRPELAARFRDLILRAILERARVIDEEAGYSPDTAPHGWSWADDNCCMLNAGMYDFFGYPILRGVFERYSPLPDDTRGQHSDSDMAHLLSILGRLDLTWTNFGPTVSVLDIRRHLPRAIIRGQLAPFTFSRNDEVGIAAEALRDFEMSRGERGVIFTTAGSINNGSRLRGLRLIMHVIQRYCAY